MDVALALGIEQRGWVPRGRLAEDGPIDGRYPGLRETASEDPAVRTRRNVEDADALLVIAYGEPTGGTALAVEVARALGRPRRVVDPRGQQDLTELHTWLASFEAVNVAGPRASEEPRIEQESRDWPRASWRRNDPQAQSKARELAPVTSSIGVMATSWFPEINRTR